MFYQANRHPGHAAWPSTCPVEASRPRFVKDHSVIIYESKGESNLQSGGIIGSRLIGYQPVLRKKGKIVQIDGPIVADVDSIAVIIGIITSGI